MGMRSQGLKKNTRKRIVMIGSSPEAMGGIASVVDVYRKAGLFSRWPVTYLATHCDGTAFMKLTVFLNAVLRYLILLTRGRVALVHVHAASRTSFLRKSLLLFLAMVVRRPFVLHLHGGEFKQYYEQEIGVFWKRYVRFILENAARVIVLSPSWKTWVSNVIETPNIVSIANPVFVNRYVAHPTDKKSPTILFLGRLEQGKGIYDLIEVMTRLKTQIPGVRLMCGGVGDIEKIRKEVLDKGIEANVELLGWVTGSAKEKLLAEAAVYVLPSYSEGLPMGLLEAMASGLPVVATTVGGIPDLVSDRVEGLLIPPGDCDAFADAIDELLRNPELRKSMGAAGLKKVRAEYSAEHICNQIGALYQELGVDPTVSLASQSCHGE